MATIEVNQNELVCLLNLVVNEIQWIVYESEMYSDAYSSGTYTREFSHPFDFSFPERLSELFILLEKLIAQVEGEWMKAQFVDALEDYKQQVEDLKHQSQEHE